jgi:hypothetical protein
VPLPSAIKLIYKHFNMTPQNPTFYQHPIHIKKFIKNLNDNHGLTVMQFDSLIAYLKERQEQQRRVEIGDDEVFRKEKNLISFGQEKREKMQEQIYDILTRKSEEKKIEHLTESDVKKIVTAMKNDVGVQKAIKRLKESKEQIYEMAAGPSRLQN